MYPQGAILRLREQRADVTVGEGEEQRTFEFPYNRVRVLGQSPIRHAGINSEWVGQQADGVIIEPLSSFGSNLDEPFGKMQDLYEVESLPEPVVIENTIRQVTAADLGPSPEDVFAEAARQAGVEKTPPPPPPVSPLDEDPDAEAKAAKIKEAKERLRGSSSN